MPTAPTPVSSSASVAEAVAVNNYARQILSARYPEPRVRELVRLLWPVFQYMVKTGVDGDFVFKLLPNAMGRAYEAGWRGNVTSASGRMIPAIAASRMSGVDGIGSYYDSDQEMF